jgi:hypothetical protein
MVPPELETGNWKLETGNWKLETGNWKLKDRDKPMIVQNPGHEPCNTQPLLKRE